MIFDRLAWIGFITVAFGWTLMLSAPQLAEFLASKAMRSAVYLNMPSVALCTIFTGFGLAILGALQTGFGALNKFFESVLERTANPRAKSIAHHPAQRKKIVERGWLKNRAYVLFMDGSVEIETMLGRRIFPSLQEAQDFIA